MSRLLRVKSLIEGTVGRIPQDQRQPFGWPTLTLLPDQPVRLHLQEPTPSSNNTAWLRLAVAVDSRQPMALELHDNGGRLLSRFDIRYPSALQVFQAPLKPIDIKSLESGAWLRLSETEQPLHLFADTTPAAAFSPHLLLSQNPSGDWRDFQDRLNSLDSLCEYGWMQGSVLDGLYHLGYQQTFESQLEHFFPGDQMIYEDFYSRPCDNQVHGLETTLMFASLARSKPDHPGIDACLKYFSQHTHESGNIRSTHTAAEHAYTVAYPLAVIGRLRDDAELQRVAAEQLQHRCKLLFRDQAIFLRSKPNGELSFRNWSRGCAWFLLGIARTLAELPEQLRPQEVIQTLRDAIYVTASHQRDNGLWRVFLDEEEATPETSGSAGIAAAIAVAVQHNWVADSFMTHANLARQGIVAFLTPDGMLTGMSQSNKSEGREDLQRSGYRVIGPCAMGLTAQLLAAAPGDLR